MRPILATGLHAVFVGTRGRSSSPHGENYYDGVGNKFWTLLYEAGLTPRLLRADEDETLLRYGYGLTDLVYDDEVADLEGLLTSLHAFDPTVVAFVSKTAASSYASVAGQRRPRGYGALSWTVAGRPAFVLPGSSGANNAMSVPLRAAMWRDLADFVDAVS